MENQNAQSTYTEKEMFDDTLSSQKFLTENYNTWANECASPMVKSEFMALLQEEHQIQHEVFCLMQNRGWYQVEQAQQTKVDQARQKYTGAL